MTDGPRAIQTRYAGCLFRSRLEARWAVYFDGIGLRWIYEHEGFDLGPLGWYLPDFWFPALGCWGEVKPRQFTEKEFAKAAALPNPCILLDDQPEDRFWFIVGIEPIEEHGSYQYYLKNENWGRLHLSMSICRRCLWICLGESLDDYGEYEECSLAVEAARSARFEGAAR